MLRRGSTVASLQRTVNESSAVFGSCCCLSSFNTSSSMTLTNSSARCCAAVRHQTASFAPFATTRIQTTKPVKVVAAPSASAPRLEGVIREWHFVERTGEIEVRREGLPEEEPGDIYKIKNAQSFETIMPTSHRQSLVGAKVRFVPISEPAADDPAQIDRSAIGIEMTNLEELLGKRHGGAGASSGLDAASAASSLLSPKELAKRLSAGGVDRGDEPTQNKPTWGIKDMRAETMFAPGGFLHQGTGSSYVGPRVSSSGALTRLEQRDLGDGMTLEGNLVRVEAPAGFYLDGEIVAWSGITRTGLIRVPDQQEADGRDVQYAVSNVDAFNSAMPSSTRLRGARVRFRPVHMHAVGNADEVVASSGQCKLRLGKVVLSLAERIDVVQLPAAREQQLEMQRRSIAAEAESIAAGESSSERRAKAAAAARESRAQKLFKEWREEEAEEFGGARGGDDSPSSTSGAASPAVSPPQFGVVTRWSGGQGIIESATGRTYRIESTKEFATYFDVSSVSVRGAVVEFVVKRERPRYAADIKILSDMTAAKESGSIAESSNAESVKRSGGAAAAAAAASSGGSSVPLSNLPFDLAIDATQFGSSTSTSSNVGTEEAAAPASAVGAEAPEKQDKKTTVDLSQLPARYGILVTYSAAEFQGVIKDEDTGERFLLRDTRQDVQNFGRVKTKLARGCRLEFRTVGASRRLATFASLTMLANGETPDVVDQEELDASEGIAAPGQQQGDGMGPRQDEAVAGPMAMSYWVARFEKVGCNMQDFKNFQQQAFVPGEAPKDPKTGKAMEVEDFRKNDPWFNDPEKNKKIPGTNARYSDLMQLNQTGLMDLSNDFRDPAKVQKKIKEVDEKLPLEYREMGWKKAKEFGPKYLKAIKQAQDRGDSAANFNFSG